MKQHRHLTGRYRKPRRAGRYAVPAVLALIAIMVCAYFYATRPANVSRLAGGLLENITGTEVRIESARVGLDNIIKVRNISMYVPEMEPDGGRIFAAEQVLIQFNPWSLFSGEFEARSITFIRPTLHLTQDMQTGKFNYQILREQREEEEQNEEEQEPLRMLPEIFIRQGEFRFGEIDDKSFVTRGTFELVGNLNSFDQEPGRYSFTLRQIRNDFREPVQLIGTFDVETLAVRADLHHFRFEGTQKQLLPEALREWWERLEPEGSFQRAHVVYDPAAADEFEATIEVSDVGLTLPIAPEPLRLQTDTGRFLIRNKHVTISNLRGSIAGFTYDIKGTIDGLNEEAPFDMHMEVDGILPRDTNELTWMPADIRSQLADVSPSGHINTKLNLVRPEPNGAVGFTGTLVMTDGAIRYAAFPYPLEHVSATLKLSDTQAEIVELKGVGPTDGVIELAGTIKPLSAEAGIDLQMTGRNLPFDDHLLNALKEKHRELLFKIFAPWRYEKIGHPETGVVQSQATRDDLTAKRAEVQRSLNAALAVAEAERDQQAVDELNRMAAKLDALIERPVFERGGKFDLKAHVTREIGPDHPTDADAEIDLKDTPLMLMWWPYPIIARTGTITLIGTTTTLKNIKVEGVRGGHGVINGVVGPSDFPGKKYNPLIDFNVDGLNIDPLLAASLPTDAQNWLHSVSLQGTADAKGRVDRDDEGNLRLTVGTTVADGTAQPWGGRYTLEHLNADATITLDGVRLSQVTAVHGKSKLAFSGGIDSSTDDTLVEVNAVAEGLDLADPILDLLPPQEHDLKRVHSVFEDYKPSGTFDAKIAYRSGGGKPVDYHMDLMPHSIAFTLRDREVAFRDTKGHVIVTPGGLELDRWTGSFDEKGIAVVSGTATFGDMMKTRMTFDVRNDELDDITRAFLPSTVLRTLDGFEFTGAYHLQNARLELDNHGEGVSAYRFSSQVFVEDAKAKIGLPITKLKGVLDFSAAQGKDDKYPTMELTLDAESLLAADRLIAPLKAKIVSGDDPTVLNLEDLHGECYGGRISGNGQVRLDIPGRYAMRLTLEDAAVRSIMDPSSAKTHPVTENNGDEPHNKAGTYGRMAVDLTISGDPDKVESRSGRGSLQVRDADLQRIPLGLSLVTMLNLSAPVSQSFDRADATFVVDGRSVSIDSVSLDAPTIRIVGDGNMDYLTRKLDLSMVVRNPGGADLGALTEVFQLFKDEMVSIQVTGTLDKPRTSVRSLKGVSESVDEVFGSAN